MCKDNHHHDHGFPRPECPRCGNTETQWIAYGFVDVGAYLGWGKRTPDFELGGLEPRDENWCCPRCGHKWAGS